MSCYRCPVCNGKGIVPNGFYSTTQDSWTSSSVEPETCKTCDGKGVVFDNTYQDVPTE